MEGLLVLRGRNQGFKDHSGPGVGQYAAAIGDEPLGLLGNYLDRNLYREYGYCVWE